MGEWKKIKLKEVLTEVTERNKDERVKNVLSVTNSQGFVKQEEYFEGTVHSQNISNYKIIRKNQFAYNPSRVNVGSIDILKTYDEGALSPMYVVFKVDNSKLLPEYFKYYFQTHKFAESVKNNTQGSVRNSLSFKSLCDFNYCLPSIEEQEKIVKILNNSDRIVEKIEAYIIEIEKNKKIVLKKCINDGKMKCKLKKLGEICKIYGRIGYRGYTTKDIVNKEENGAISLSPGNIVNNKLFLEKENTYISNFKYEESPEIKIFNGDIIFVKTGSSYGKVAIIEGLNEKATLNPQLVVLKNIACDGKLLSEILATNYVRKQVDKCISGGIVPTLTQKEMESYKIYIPVEEQEQLKLSNFLKQSDIKIARLYELKSKYIKLKEALMQQLLTGKIKVKI